MPFKRWIVAALSATLLASSAMASSYDPRMTWRTLQTEHFNIHFHQGEEALAEEFSHVVEDVYDEMTEEIQWTPRRRIEIVLVDRTDYANGYASTVPYNQIVLFATAPTPDSTLAQYEDWPEMLFTHELTHILHLDANHGIVRAARSVVGRIASTNQISPWWMVEGFATFQETRHSIGGRGRATVPDMIKRTAALEDAWPPLGNMDGFEPYLPGGNLRYLFGQDFIQYVADHQGEDVWTRWVHTYGSSIPYVFSLPPVAEDSPVWPARRSFGRPIVPMYFDWKDAAFERYQTQADTVRADGPVTQGRMVSGGTASCSAPSFSPDGDTLVWSCYDLKTGSAIWKADGEGYAREVLLQDRGANQFTWRSDSQAFVYSGIHLVNRFNTWSDIYLHNLGANATMALTSGARARDPAFSPDGSRLLYVTNKSQQNQLQVMTVDQRKTTLTANEDHTQYSTPRYSPDGRSIAVSMWRDGRTDLWILDPRGQPARRITQDLAIEADPVWSEDGKWLLFTSDRSGIPNVYAVDVATERLFQVTNVLTGASRAAIHPSGERIAFQQYSQDGWDIIVLDWDPDTFLDRGLLPRPLRYDTPLADLTGPRTATPDDDQVARWEHDRRVLPDRLPAIAMPTDTLGVGQNPPTEGLDSFDADDVDDVYEADEDYPFTITPRRYNPLPTLVPTYVAPGIQSTTEPSGPLLQDLLPDVTVPGFLGSLSTGSADPLRHLGWSAFGTYRTDAEALGGGASFTVNRWLPVFTVAANSRALSRGRVPLVDPTAPFDADGSLVVDRNSGPTYWERRSEVIGQVSWPYRLRTTVFANYAYTSRSSIFDLPDEAYLAEIPLRGTTGALSAGWRYSWAQQTPLAISLEDARIFSLVGSVLSPWLGTAVLQEDGSRAPLTQLQVTSEVRNYWVNPLVPNHVIATRLGAGVTLGGTDFLGNYLLGGSFGDSAFYVTPDGSTMLRGYVFGADIGDMYWTGNLEYRLPLWYIHRGVGTLPGYARHLSAAAFVDAGNAFNSPVQAGRAATGTELLQSAFSQPLVGVGGELQFSGIFLWAVGLNGRLGYAYGVTPYGVRPQTPGLVYFQLGGTF